MYICFHEVMESHQRASPASAPAVACYRRAMAGWPLWRAAHADARPSLVTANGAHSPVSNSAPANSHTMPAAHGPYHTTLSQATCQPWPLPTRRRRDITAGLRPAPAISSSLLDLSEAEHLLLQDSADATSAASQVRQHLESQQRQQRGPSVTAVNRPSPTGAPLLQRPTASQFIDAGAPTVASAASTRGNGGGEVISKLKPQRLSGPRKSAWPVFSDDDPWVSAAYDSLPVTVTGREPPVPLRSYNELTRGPRRMPKLLLRNAAAGFHLSRPTPIQRHVIPAVMDGENDVEC